ncbi:MAG: ATP-binding protein [Candidatus Xenobiia bacterium LiM19]
MMNETMNETKKIKVLHIDDDEAFLKLFRKTYEDEFDIVSIPGGEDVPEIVGRETPDALVLDYELPGRNGLELLSAIMEKHPSLPVIFCTGQGNEEVARQAFKEGATDYFVKRTADFAQKEKLVNSVRKAVERRAMEDELAEKQAMLEGIIEYNPYSIAMYDSLGRTGRVNKAHTRLFGVSPSLGEGLIFDDSIAVPEGAKEAMRREWLAKRDNFSIFTDESAMQNEEIKRLMPSWQGGEVVKFPAMWYTPPLSIDNSPIQPKCLATTGFSVKDSRGNITQYVYMHEDITARVEAEEALKTAHEDLQIAHEELKKAYESVEQKVTERTAELADANTKLQAENDERVRLQAELEKQNTELESFSHTVSHDLRNNLLVMQRLMERDNMAQDDRQKTQELLLNNTAHLQQFVERLLFLAQAGRTIAEKRKVSLDEAALKAFSMAAASDGNAELSVISPFPPVLCDPQAFEQIFSNLFNNSLIYSNPDAKPVIKVGCAINNCTAEITVQDNGKGLDPGVLPKVFGSTFTTDRREHFGLGLAIVKKLVEAHGGTIRAESDGPGKGAAFIITLPHDS